MVSLFLVFLIFFILCLSLLINKDIIFPSNIIILGFLIAAICSFMVLNKLHNDISEYTLYVIVTFLIVFFISSVLSNHVTGNYLSKKENLNKKNDIRFIDVNNLKIILMICFQLFAILSFVFEFNKLVGPINSSNLAEYRFYTSYSAINIYKMPSWVSVLGNLSQMASIVSIYILINNSFFKSKKINNLLLIISSFMSIPIPILNSSRYNIMIIIIYAFTLYIYLEKRVTNKVRKSLGVIILSMILIVVIFPLLGYLIGRPSGQTSSFEYYFGGGIALFDSYIKDPFAMVSNNFGFNTFTSVYKFLNKLGVGIQYIKPSYEFRYINGQMIGNVYTCLLSYIIDFGFFGMCFISAIVGIIYGAFNKVVSVARLDKVNILVIAYFYSMYTLVLSAYSETIFSTLLSAGFYINILIIYIISKYYAH